MLLYPEQVKTDYPNFPDMQTYLRSVTVNFGLSGLLMYRTPRDVIEGYTDPLVATLAEIPIYMGGDATTSPFLAMNNPPTHPPNNTVAFFTGEDDYEMTRVYGKWLDSEYITMASAEYTSLTNIENITFSPWADRVLLDGTDGMQFSPVLDKDAPIKAFVNDLSRNCFFDYSYTSDKYPHLDTYMYTI